MCAYYSNRCTFFINYIKLYARLSNNKLYYLLKIEQKIAFLCVFYYEHMIIRASIRIFCAHAAP